MVANMTFSSHARQPHNSPPRKESAPPQKYAWLFKTSAASKPATKADMSGPSGMVPSPDDSANSWETRAFAEDASSLAAGIWPPRAYPCSFCRREFRSAQALGGHMNVHRRDRARLRYSSPPSPTPYCPPFTVPQPRALFQAHDKYAVNQSGGYLNKSLIKLNSAPISPSKCSNSPENTPNPSLISNYNATSFPLRLQKLASEAAASFMCSQQCKSSDLLSLWPASMTNSSVSFACHSSMSETGIKERTIEVSSSSSLTSPPSNLSGVQRPPTTDSAPACRRDPPIIQAEDESPPKRSHSDKNCNHPMFKHVIACKNSLKDELHAHDTFQSSQINTKGNDTSGLEQRSAACGGDVDLELRLGQRLSP